MAKWKPNDVPLTNAFGRDWGDVSLQTFGVADDVLADLQNISKNLGMMEYLESPEYVKDRTRLVSDVLQERLGMSPYDIESMELLPEIKPLDEEYDWESEQKPFVKVFNDIVKSGGRFGIQPSKLWGSSYLGSVVNNSMTNAWWKLVSGNNIVDDLGSLEIKETGLHYDGALLKTNPTETKLLQDYVLRKTGEDDNLDFLDKTARVFGSLVFDLPLIILASRGAGAAIRGVSPVLSNLTKADTFLGRLYGQVLQQGATFNIMGVPQTVAGYQDKGIVGATEAIYHSSMMGVLAATTGTIGTRFPGGIFKKLMQRSPAMMEEMGGIAGSFGFGTLSSTIGGEDWQDALSTGLAFAATHFASPKSYRRVLAEFKRKGTEVYVEPYTGNTDPFAYHPTYFVKESGKLFPIDANKFKIKGEIVKVGDEVTANTDKLRRFSETVDHYAMTFSGALHNARVMQQGKKLYNRWVETLPKDYVAKNKEGLRLTANVVASQIILGETTKLFERHFILPDKLLSNEMIKLGEKLEMSYDDVKRYVVTNLPKFLANREKFVEDLQKNIHVPDPLKKEAEKILEKAANTLVKQSYKNTLETLGRPASENELVDAFGRPIVESERAFNERAGVLTEGERRAFDAKRELTTKAGKPYDRYDVLGNVVKIEPTEEGRYRIINTSMEFIPDKSKIITEKQYSREVEQRLKEEKLEADLPEVVEGKNIKSEEAPEVAKLEAEKTKVIEIQPLKAEDFKRGKDFAEEGVYEANVGGEVFKIFRDTQQFGYPIWYRLENDGKTTQLGFSKKEAVDRLNELRKKGAEAKSIEDKQKPTSVPSEPVEPTTKPDIKEEAKTLPKEEVLPQKEHIDKTTKTVEENAPSEEVVVFREELNKAMQEGKQLVDIPDVQKKAQTYFEWFKKAFAPVIEKYGQIKSASAEKKGGKKAAPISAAEMFALFLRGQSLSGKVQKGIGESGAVFLGDTELAGFMRLIDPTGNWSRQKVGEHKEGNRLIRTYGGEVYNQIRKDYDALLRQARAKRQETLEPSEETVLPQPSEKLSKEELVGLSSTEVVTEKDKLKRAEELLPRTERALTKAGIPVTMENLTKIVDYITQNKKIWQTQEDKDNAITLITDKLLGETTKGTELYSVDKDATGQKLSPEEYEAILQDFSAQVGKVLNPKYERIPHKTEGEAKAVTRVFGDIAEVISDPRWLSKETATEEGVHIVTRTLEGTAGMDRLLKKAGWDGEGRGTDNESWVNAHEKLAYDYLRYSPENRTLWDKMSDAFDKMAAFFRGKGFYAKADFFKALAERNLPHFIMKHGGKGLPSKLYEYVSPYEAQELRTNEINNAALTNILDRYENSHAQRTRGYELYSAGEREKHENFEKGVYNSVLKKTKKFFDPEAMSLRMGVKDYVPNKVGILKKWGQVWYVAKKMYQEGSGGELKNAQEYYLASHGKMASKMYGVEQTRKVVERKLTGLQKTNPGILKDIGALLNWQSEHTELITEKSPKRTYKVWDEDYSAYTVKEVTKDHLDVLNMFRELELSNRELMKEQDKLTYNPLTDLEWITMTDGEFKKLGYTEAELEKFNDFKQNVIHNPNVTLKEVFGDKVPTELENGEVFKLPATVPVPLNDLIQVAENIKLKKSARNQLKEYQQAAANLSAYDASNKSILAEEMLSKFESRYLEDAPAQKWGMSDVQSTFFAAKEGKPFSKVADYLVNKHWKRIEQDGYKPDETDIRDKYVLLVKDNEGNTVARRHFARAEDAIEMKKKWFENRENVNRDWVRKVGLEKYGTRIPDEKVWTLENENQISLEKVTNVTDYLLRNYRTLGYHQLHTWARQAGLDVEKSAELKQLDEMLKNKSLERRWLKKEFKVRNPLDASRDLEAVGNLSNEIIRQDFRNDYRLKATELYEKSKDPVEAKLLEDFRDNVLADTRVENAVIGVGRQMAYAGALFNPRFWFVNGTQTFTVGLPIMAQHYGWRALSEWGKLQGQVDRILKGVYDLAEGKTPSEKVDAELLNVGFEAYKRGLLSPILTEEQMMGDTSLRRKAKGVTQHIIGIGNRQIEARNRLFGLLAGYKISKDVHKEVDFEKQMLMGQIVNAEMNTVPKLMMPTALANQRGWLRTILQAQYMFKSFPLNFMHLYSQSAKNSYKWIMGRETANYKPSANDAIAFALFNAPLMLLGGISALPFAGDMAQTMKTLGVGDAETKLRELMNEMGGIMAEPWLADAMISGTPTLLDVNISQNVGLGDLAQAVPGAQFVTEELLGLKIFDYKQNILGGLGILSDVPASVTRYLQEAHELGSFSEALRTKPPFQSISIIRGMTKALVQNEQGLKDKYGHTLVAKEDYNYADFIFQGFGFTPEKTAKAYALESAQDYEDKAVNDYRRMARTRMEIAVRKYLESGDMGEIRNTMNLITEGNKDLQYIEKQMKGNEIYRSALKKVLDDTRYRKRDRQTQKRAIELKQLYFNQSY